MQCLASRERSGEGGSKIPLLAAVPGDGTACSRGSTVMPAEAKML